MNFYLGLFLGAIGATLLFFALIVSAEFRRLRADMSAKIEAQQAQIDELEKCQPKAHAHKNAVTIENVLAWAIKAKLNMRETAEAVDAMNAILRDWRGDPNYLPESERKEEL